MSNTNNTYIGFARGVSSDFSPATANPNTLYFLTDTNQIFLGGEEFSKGVEELSSAPTASLIGVEGKLYIYNNILYTYLNNNWTITGFTNWTMLNGFPEDSDFHFLAYQDQDPNVSPAVMIPLSVIKTNLGTSGSGDVVDGSITTIKIADGAVTQEKLAENSVSSTQIVGYTIGHLEISKDAIYTDALQNNAVTPEKLDRQYLERRRLWTTITTWTDLFNTVVLSTDTQHPTTLQFMLSCEAPLPDAYEGTGLTIQRGICWSTSASTIFIHSMNNMNCVWRIQKKTSSTSSKLNYQKSETVDGVTYYYIIELMQTQSESIANEAVTPEKLDRSYQEVVILQEVLPYDSSLVEVLSQYIKTNTTVIGDVENNAASNYDNDLTILYGCSFKYEKMTSYTVNQYISYNYYHFDTYIPALGKHYDSIITESISSSEGTSWLEDVSVVYKDPTSTEKGSIIDAEALYAVEQGYSGMKMNGTYSLIGDYCFMDVMIPTLQWGDMFYPLPVPAVQVSNTVITTFSMVGDETSTNSTLSKNTVGLGVGWRPVYNETTTFNGGVLMIYPMSSSSLDGNTIYASFYYKYK